MSALSSGDIHPDGQTAETLSERPRCEFFSECIMLEKSFKNKNHKYYDEREWRLVPSKFRTEKSFLTKEDWLDIYIKEKT